MRKKSYSEEEDRCISPSAGQGEVDRAGSKKRRSMFPSSASSGPQQSKCVPTDPAAPPRPTTPRPHSYLIYAYENIVPAPRPELIEDDGAEDRQAVGRLISRSQYTA